MDIFDLLRNVKFTVVRNGKAEKYQLQQVASDDQGLPIEIHLNPLDKQPPAPPPAEIYILRKHHKWYKSSFEGVYAKQEQAKDSAHYWARQERQDWAKMLEKPMTWEESDIPLVWGYMVDSMHGNPTSWICADSGLATFVIEHYTVQDFELRHTVQKHDHGPDDNCDACYNNEPSQSSGVTRITGRLS